MWHCKGACGECGVVILWVQRAEGVSFKHALELLKKGCAPSSGPMVKVSTVPKLPCPMTMGGRTVCESLIDGLTFWCAGYRNVTGSNGVNGFTNDHRAAFETHGIKRVYIAYDADQAGNKAAVKLPAEPMQSSYSIAPRVGGLERRFPL
ncbi:MAG: toprim domain-containing protein [Acidobacteriaceae bacterium]